MVLLKNYHNSDGSGSYPFLTSVLNSKTTLKPGNTIECSFTLEVRSTQDKAVLFLFCLGREV